MIRKGLILMCALAAAACATTPQQIPAGGVNLSDEEIAAIMQVVHEGEIQQGEVARTRASSAEVRAFAEMMVRDHTAALARARDVFARANITPRDNNLSTTLRNGAQQTASALSGYSGAEFDRNYMRTQVDMHDWVLRTIDTSLLPSAGSTQLMRMLRDARPGIAAHLERARQIQGGLR